MTTADDGTTAEVIALRAYARRAAVLQQLMADLTRAETIAAVGSAVSLHGAALFDASATLLFLLDPAGTTLELASFGGASVQRVESWRRMPLDGRSALADCVRAGEPLWLGSRHAVLAAYPELAGVQHDGAGLQGIVAIPVRDSRRVIGGMAMSFYAPPDLSPVQRDFYGTVASLCGVAIERSRQREVAAATNARLQRQQQRLALVASASELLTSSLDSRKALTELARAVVPALGDWCVIDERREAGADRIVVHHRDPAKLELAARLNAEYPPEPDETRGVLKVLRTGETEWVPLIPDDMLVRSARDEVHRELILGLRLSSYAIVPIRARGEVVGALSLVTEGDRRLDEHDVRDAEDLARRAGLALDNARLFEAVTRSEARMRALVNAAAAIVWTATPAGEVVETSPSWLAFTGQTEAEYRGGGFVNAIHPEDRESTLAIWAAATSAGAPYAAAYRLRRPDGSYAHTLARGNPVRDEAGTVVEYVGCNVDVSELHTAIRDLEATNRELDQFAYVASHDLRAPLRAISSLAEWIEEDLGDAMTSDARSKMDLLRSRVQRMEALIQGILDFSRIGRTAGKIEELDVAALLADVVDLVGAQGAAKVTIQPGMPVIVSERVALQQVFMNLITNGLKYANRPDAHVRVAAHDRGDRWEFRVADNGPGIAPEFHERVWGIFQTLQPRDKVESTGIGLAIVRKLVHGRGGRAWIESNETQGATVCFTWPKREAKRG
jgi:PAS domain S-box-containing protein